MWWWWGGGEMRQGLGEVEEEEGKGVVWEVPPLLLGSKECGKYRRCSLICSCGKKISQSGASGEIHSMQCSLNGGFKGKIKG